MNAEIMEWKRLADMDLVTAKHMFETYRPIPVEIVCFHSQQAAEKMLKCFLVFHEIEPPKTHDLKSLIKMCIEIESEYDTINKEAALLSEYAVLPRYPAEFDLDETDGERAIKSADKIVNYVNELIGSS